MQWIAQSWLVYRLTDSAAWLGFVGFAGQIPVFLLAPIGGAVADRHNRHRILVMTQAASMLLAFILAALTLTQRVQVWEVFMIASLLGVVNAFDIPTRQAFLMDMVGREDLLNAIALNSSMFNGARIVGPAVGGLLVASIGEGWCFFANAVSYLAVIAGLLLMKIDFPTRVAPDRLGAEQHHRRFSLCRKDGADSGLVDLTRTDQSPGDAVCRAHADLRRSHPARRGSRARTVDGGLRGGRPDIRVTSRGAAGGERSGALGQFFGHRFWSQPHPVFPVPMVLAFRGPSFAGGFLPDGGNGRLQHPDSIHGTGQAARTGHVRLFHDVHGHGPVRSAPGRDHGPPPGGSNHRGPRRSRRCSGWRRVRIPAAGSQAGSPGNDQCPATDGGRNRRRDKRRRKKPPPQKNKALMRTTNRNRFRSKTNKKGQGKRPNQISRVIFSVEIGFFPVEKCGISAGDAARTSASDGPGGPPDLNPGTVGVLEFTAIGPGS